MSAKKTFAVSRARHAVCRPLRSVLGTLPHPPSRPLPSPAPLHHVQRRLISNSQNHLPTRCPACRATPKNTSAQDLSPTATAICHNCASFLPLSGVGSHFSLFGLPQAYRLDRDALRKQYHRWQQVVHPDLALSRQNQSNSSVSGDRDLQASLGEQWSIAVNRARARLDNDIKRAAYMLELDGTIAMPEEGGNSSVNPTLLMTIMETHEKLEESKSQTEVDEIQALNKEMMQEIVTELEMIWKVDCNLELDQLERAKELAIKLQYLDTIDGACRTWRPSTAT